MNGYTKKQLAADLRAVRKMPIRTRLDLDEWNQRARAIAQKLEAIPEEIESFHFLMHYLMDADIRSKDPRYAHTQEAELDFAIDVWDRA